MLRKFLLLLGILVLVFVLATAAFAGAALVGKAQECPSGAGPLRSDRELLFLIETKGLTITDAEATALIQKSLSGKVENARICFTPGLAHLSGRLKAGGLSPSFYVSTGVDLSGLTPKTKNLDIRFGAVPNLFIFSPIEKMIEGMINENLSRMKIQDRFSVEFKAGSATIKKVK